MALGKSPKTLLKAGSSGEDKDYIPILNWYAVYTKPGKEASTSKLLSKGGFEVYTPMLRLKKYLRGHYREVVEPMFPSYIFVRFDLVTHLWTVAYTRGVKKVLGPKEAPWRIPDEMIEFFLSRETAGIISPRYEELKEGDAVRIADGPFARLSAVFERPMKGTDRAVLLLGAIEYQVRVIVDRASLVKAD